MTKDLWEEFFFRGGQERWKHQAWANLTRHGHFQPYAYERLSNIRVLNRYNKEVTDLVQGRAARPPSPAQIDHDEILNRGVMTLERVGVVRNWRSETELKASGGHDGYRIETQGQLIKFPDALVHGARGERPLAIELERTLKSRSRYRQIMSAYAGMKNLGAILFVTDTPAVDQAIREAMKASYFPEADIAVGFARIEEWQAEPARMEVQSGRERVRLEQWMTLHLDCTDRTMERS